MMHTNTWKLVCMCLYKHGYVFIVLSNVTKNEKQCLTTMNVLLEAEHLVQKQNLFQWSIQRYDEFLILHI